MQAGKLDKRIQLLKHSSTKDQSGGIIDTFTPDRYIWANVKDLSGSQALIAQQLTTSITTEITIRYTNEVRNVDKFYYKNRTFEIKAGPIEIGRNKFVKYMCKAIVS